MNRIIIASLLASSIAPLPAFAADKPKDAMPQVATCEKSFGTIAVTDGDTQGWTQFGLGSPRDLIAAIIAESGCFQAHSPASGVPATFLMTAVAGAKEEIDQTVNTAKGLATEGLLRSGALGGMGGGAIRAMGMLGGLGGKKKTISAGLRSWKPASSTVLKPISATLASVPAKSAARRSFNV